MEGNGKTLSEDQLIDLQSRKTGSLLSAACLLGAIVGGADAKQREAAQVYGAAIGAAFQIRDDMLDALSTDEAMGKTVGTDEREQKTTFMSLYGAEKCEKMIARLTENAKSTVSAAFPEPRLLVEFADALAAREK